VSLDGPKLGAARMLIPDNAVLVDTNIMSYAIRRAPIAREYQCLLAGRTILVSVVTLAELHFWAKKDSWDPTRHTQLRRLLCCLPEPAALLYSGYEFR
jgi:predicted nucleic acid-binding protein